MRPEITEKCGVFGVFTPGFNSAYIVIEANEKQQHRGQDGTGTVSTNAGGKLVDRRGAGRVKQIFPEGFDLSLLPGEISLGHTRYGTSTVSQKLDAHVQPVIGSSRRVAFAHNGNLPDTRFLDREMEQRGIPDREYNDTEKMTAVVADLVDRGASLEEAIEKAAPLFTGAWSIVAMDSKMGKLVAARDSKGIRPLSIGRSGNGIAFASETVAFGNPLNIEYLRDVNPGEMVIYDGNTLESRQIMPGENRLEIFEPVYFAHPDSILNGQRVGGTRINFGREAANEIPNMYDLRADIVVGVPNSGLLAAQGFAEQSGIELAAGLSKRKEYTGGRTFIQPSAEDKIREVRKKLEADPNVLRGKSIILVDDSLVRGNTLPPVIEMARNEGGAREVHVVIASAPVEHPNHYGINTPTYEELAANRHSTIESLAYELKADSLHYLSVEGMIRATGNPGEMYSLADFTGKYPIPTGREIRITPRINLHTAPRVFSTSQS